MMPLDPATAFSRCAGWHPRKKIGMLKKIFTRYAVLGFIVSALTPAIVYAGSSLAGGAGSTPALALGSLMAVLLGWIGAAASPLPASLFARLCPLLLPPLLLPLAYAAKALLDEPILVGLFWGIILILLGGIYSCFCLSFLFFSERISRSAAKARGAATLLGVALVCFGAAAWGHTTGLRDILDRNRGEASVGHGIDTWRYRPFSKDSELVKPAAAPSLRIDSGYPRLDGAVAAYPVYAAYAQALYVGLDEKTARQFVDCTNTVEAYKRLADGKIDIFFGAAPSAGQRAYAQSKGLSLTEIPVGKEAFVFFTHTDSPVRSLTREQIKGVYGGRIRNWKELGGPDEAILAFQRPEGSGSQTAMLIEVMQGQAMAKPLREERSHGMGDIVLGVAAYRNRKNALGYSFRWYATALFANPDIRLLAVDGVLPTPENIRNGTYPFTVSLLAVTARPLSPQCKKLLDWIRGSEGQNLLERVGYVPLRQLDGAGDDLYGY